VPDPYRGETVKAFVVTKPGVTLTEEEVISFCKGELAAYKVPTKVEFIDELPKSAIGKIMRRTLREMDRKKRGSRMSAIVPDFKTLMFEEREPRIGVVTMSPGRTAQRD
jgi:acyl-coenzyme A synthetase/AMP-(fatty) acid ligase